MQSTPPNIDAEVERIQALAYRRELVPDSGGWVARIPEFPGCVVEADSPTEALAQLEGVMATWIRIRIASSAVVPAPAGDPEYSGRFVVRLPSWMHRSAAERAQAEGVSLNRFIESSLSYALGLTGMFRPNPAVVSVTQSHEDAAEAVRQQPYVGSAKYGHAIDADKHAIFGKVAASEPYVIISMDRTDPTRPPSLIASVKANPDTHLRKYRMNTPSGLTDFIRMPIVPETES